MALAVLCLLATSAACTGPGEDPAPTADASEPEIGTIGVPPIPTPTPQPAPEPTGDPVADVALATEAPVAGATVLLHLEGPPDDRESTDVVVRNESGEELARYRLAGARSVHASPGATTALIRVVPDRWVRYNAVSGTLSRVLFPDTAPASAIEVGSGVIGPTALWQPSEASYLLRMDTGEVTDLRSDAAPRQLQELSDDGSVAILRDALGGLSVLRTVTGELRALAGRSAVLSADGQVLGVVAADGQARLEALDGQVLAALGEVGAGAQVLPLGVDRALVLGPRPALLGPQGETPVTRPGAPTTAPTPTGQLAEPLAPTQLGPPLRVSADQRFVLATTTSGLALVDVQAQTIQPIPSTTGWLPVDIGSAAVLWAHSGDAGQPGALSVDPATGAVTRVLEDQPTGAPLSVSADGQTIAFQTSTADGDRAAAVVAAGSPDPLPLPAGAGDAPETVALHPAGALMALTTAGGESGVLVIADRAGDAGPLMSVPDGRQPVWLTRTT